MHSLSILGVSGTIGQNCLKVLDANPDAFEVIALTANDNAEALARAAIHTRATFAALANESKYAELKTLLAGKNIEIAAGEEAIAEAAARSSDVVLAAIVGAAGLKPTLKAVERGATIALANKECLVCAGEVFMRAVNEHGAALVPVDSEHNAIFQLIQTIPPIPSFTPPASGGGKGGAITGSTARIPPLTSPPQAGGINFVEKITLTASGGPFRNWSLEQMKTATPKQAVAHPNWQMGAKISVDSATMANKGLELIEAMHLFNLPPEKLGVLIHPESIVHGLVEMRDGSVLAQMSEPDMCIPIAYALGFPARLNSVVKKLNLATLGKLTFEAPDESRFPALRLAREVMQSGSSAACIFNAANEVAVQAFLDGQIGFLDIIHTIEYTLQRATHSTIFNVNDVLYVDAHAREIASACVAPKSRAVSA